jgi:hypothetical protein
LAASAAEVPVPAEGDVFTNITIVIYVDGGTKTGAEITLTSDPLGYCYFQIDNRGGGFRSYFRGERGRPLLGFDYLSITSEEGKLFYAELDSGLAAIKPLDRATRGDVVIQVTRLYSNSDDIEFYEWPEATYDVEPLLSFLRDFMAEHSPGEIGYLKEDGYVRVIDPESPKRVTDIKFYPQGEFVHVDINEAEGNLRLPARIAAYGSFCKARTSAVDVYLFGQELRYCVDEVERTGPAYEPLEFEIFLPFDDEALEYSGLGGPKGIYGVSINYGLKDIIDNFVDGCFEKAYYPKSLKKGLQFKKELQRRKKNGEE